MCNEGEIQMISKTTMTALAVCIAGGMMVASPSQAAPVMGSSTAVKAATTDHVTDVQWRGRGWGWRGRGWGWRGGAPWVAGAVIGGLALGAAAAANPYYYGGPYGYGPAAYDYDYAPGPY